MSAQLAIVVPVLPVATHATELPIMLAGNTSMTLKPTGVNWALLVLLLTTVMVHSTVTPSSSIRPRLVMDGGAAVAAAVLTQLLSFALQAVGVCKRWRRPPPTAARRRACLAGAGSGCRGVVELADHRLRVVGKGVAGATTKCTTTRGAAGNGRVDGNGAQRACAGGVGDAVRGRVADTDTNTVLAGTTSRKR